MVSKYMKNLHYFNSIISLFFAAFILVGCGENLGGAQGSYTYHQPPSPFSAPLPYSAPLFTPTSPSHSNSGGTIPAKITVLDNEYVNGEKVGSTFTFNIKKPAPRPIFIKGDSSFVDNEEIDRITFNDVKNIDYILLPDNHWFAQLSIANPFQSEKKHILLPRASLWGFELVKEKEESKSILFRKADALPAPTALPVMPAIDMQRIFGAYTTTILGQGGGGTVFGVFYRGHDYALKERASEAAALEKLQFTRAIIDIYGMFTYGGKQFLIMKKGQKSLRDMINDNQSLDDDMVRAAIPRFLSLIAAQKQLGITNNDIKPDNMLITDDGIKIIDIDKGYSKGYHGSAGEKCAQSLLEANLSTSLKAEYAIPRYYEFPPDKRPIVASNDYVAYWLQSICEADKLKPDCATITNYDDFFPLLSYTKLHDLGAKFNKTDSFKINGDLAGTHDDADLGNYQTGLPFPQLIDPKTIDWQSYFDKKDKLIPKFCEDIDQNNTYAKWFFNDLKGAYAAKCSKDINGIYPLSADFPNKDAQTFHNWIFDAFMPVVKLHTFIGLAEFEHKKSKVYDYIFSHEYTGARQDIGKSLLELFNRK
jgi:hypothetical protein